MQDQPDGAVMRKDAARVAARARFDALAMQDPALADLHAGEILRLAPQSLVAKGWYGGEAVVLKLFLGPKAAEIVSNMHKELTHLAGHMSMGRWQVNRMLLARPDLGLAVLSQLPGEKMSKLLPKAAPDQRSRMLRDAGRFVLAYSEGRRRMDVLGAGFWMRKFDRFDLSGLAAPDRALMQALRQALALQAQGLRQVPLCRAAIHGDFVPANLHADENGIYAFDTQGEAILPLSLDLARFMAWLAMDPVIPAGPYWYGLAKSDRNALLAKGLPAEGEHHGVLPFLLGHELAGRFYERHKDPAMAPAARRALRAYLAQG